MKKNGYFRGGRPDCAAIFINHATGKFFHDPAGLADTWQRVSKKIAYGVQSHFLL